MAVRHLVNRFSCHQLDWASQHSTPQPTGVDRACRDTEFLQHLVAVGSATGFDTMQPLTQRGFMETNTALGGERHGARRLYSVTDVVNVSIGDVHSYSVKATLATGALRGMAPLLLLDLGCKVKLP